MSGDVRLLDAVLRQNLFFFVRKAFGTLHPGQDFIDARHVEAMCWQLQEVAEGRVKRLLITVPPRHLKSVCTSVCFCAWLLGRDPSLRIMVASYAQDLASKHARDFRALLEAAWFRRCFPALQVNPRRNAEAEMLTTRMGGRKAVSLGGAVTGFGADLLIVDDLMKAADAPSSTERQRVRDFYEQTLFSRLNDKGSGRIVAIQQRLHEDDLAGYLLDKGTFRHLNLRAIAEQDEQLPLYHERNWSRRRGEALFPAREPLHTLESIRKEIGSFAFSSQYQQNPVPPDGNRIRWQWFGRYEGQPPREHFQMVVQSWDTAITAEPTSDFSVCLTWGYREKRWYLLDLLRERLEYPALKRKVQELRRRWNADAVIVEYAGTGIPLIREFRIDHLPKLEAYQPIVDKQTRLAVQTSKLEQGNFLLPAHADWLDAFKQELLAFPNGRWDDQVDALAQFLDWIGRIHGIRAVKRQLNGGRAVRPERIIRPPSLDRPLYGRRPLAAS